mmetsp:Transcript_14060/g.30526  ORF Transcript_14060/g.30526 Transcript_14060/m.30526 type:complete len:256 (-) Transcript_14060:2304-3071(-)
MARRHSRPVRTPFSGCLAMQRPKSSAKWLQKTLMVQASTTSSCILYPRAGSTSAPKFCYKDHSFTSPSTWPSAWKSRAATSQRPFCGWFCGRLQMCMLVPTTTLGASPTPALPYTSQQRAEHPRHWLCCWMQGHLWRRWSPMTRSLTTLRCSMQPPRGITRLASCFWHERRTLTFPTGSGAPASTTPSWTAGAPSPASSQRERATSRWQTLSLARRHCSAQAERRVGSIQSRTCSACAEPTIAARRLRACRCSTT